MNLRKHIDFHKNLWSKFLVCRPRSFHVSKFSIIFVKAFKSTPMFLNLLCCEAIYYHQGYKVIKLVFFLVVRKVVRRQQ